MNTRNKHFVRFDQNRDKSISKSVEYKSCPAQVWFSQKHSSFLTCFRGTDQRFANQLFVYSSTVIKLSGSCLFKDEILLQSRHLSCHLPEWCPMDTRTGILFKSLPPCPGRLFWSQKHWSSSTKPMLCQLTLDRPLPLALILRWWDYKG